MWQPKHEGEIDIEINPAGDWYHEGTRIVRQPLVDLFATILRKEGDKYYLVTPAEKLKISVADVPFLAIEMEVRGNAGNTDILFTTNVGDYVTAGPQHPLTMKQGKPYLEVRNGLLARVVRSVFYRLVEYGCEEQGSLYVYSQGAKFSLGSVT